MHDEEGESNRDEGEGDPGDVAGSAEANDSRDPVDALEDGGPPRETAGEDPFESMDLGPGRDDDPFERLEGGPLHSSEAPDADPQVPPEPGDSDPVADPAGGEHDPFEGFGDATGDPFADGQSVFDGVDADDEGVWERMDDTHGADVQEVSGRRYVEVSKHSYCEGCEHFSSPPTVECRHDGTEILEFTDMETVRVIDCPIVEERRALEDEG